MEDKVILEGNKLIAEFMGAKPCKDWQGYDGYEHPHWLHFQWSNRVQDNLELYSYRYSQLEYHSSWDWLMPIIERIESLGYRWEIGMSTISPYHYCKIWSIGSIEGISPLDAIYGACIEFIKWYNQNEKK
jgi:hypothetical protein